MPNLAKTDVRCPRCSESSATVIYHSINVSDNPELKDSVRSGELFVHTCPHCGNRFIACDNFLYLDPAAHLAVILSGATIDGSGLDREYTARRVATVGELVEKVGIFEDGLDDVVIELCKFVTGQELGREVSLKYVKMDGPDGELTFAYPENGRMEMIAVGFNVYEDCRGIVSRNPIFKEKSAGLARVDADFISQIVR